MVNPKAKNWKKILEKKIWDLKILLREVFKLGGAKEPEGARERDGQSVTSRVRISEALYFFNEKNSLYF